jgi:tRNA (guanine-N7-)-methyltransferase
LIETLLPQLALQLEPGRDPAAYFSRSVAGVWLEIGFGGGEHLLWQAENHPDIGLIGAEPYVSGVAKLLSKLAPSSASPGFSSGSPLPPRVGEKSGPSGEPHSSPAHGGASRQADILGRLRLYAEDAREIVAALPAASLERLFILFPDPWPKTRHHKRRLIQTEMLDEFARVLKPGAELRFATDDRSYLLWALERLIAHPAFAWTAEGPADWRVRPKDWPRTRYEAKAMRQGRRCTYLRFVRV